MAKLLDKINYPSDLRKFEKKDLPTTELGTTCQTGIRYIMPFLRNIVHHRKQEFCTTQKTGILYNIENRNIVHHL